MNEIADWYRAQLDEDERVARESAELAPAEWRPSEPFETTSGVLASDDDRDIVAGPVGDWKQVAGDHEGFGATRLAHATHIARHDPARVLREVAAKRAIMDECEQMSRPFPAEWLSPQMQIVRLLAAVYEDWPGYREEWRP